MKKLFLILVAIVPFNKLLLAQESEVASKLVYTELGGPGVIMSVNFDSRFDSKSQLGAGVRTGIGFGYKYIYSDIDYNERTRTYYSIPLCLNYVFGKPDNAHTFEIGGGVTLLTRKISLYCYDSEKPGNLIGHLSFMYRHVPLDGGFSFRIGLTPIVGTSGDLVPMGAIGFGYAF